LDLVLQYLKAGIVPRDKKPRHQDENHLQKQRIPVAPLQNQSLSNSLLSMSLQEATPFRTPKKSTERRNLPKKSESSHRKAGFVVGFMGIYG
jgi:hypothetical protein